MTFSCCHKPIQFSTGPHAKVSGERRQTLIPQYTHWKQTVFYTPDTLTVSVRLFGTATLLTGYRKTTRSAATFPVPPIPVITETLTSKSTTR